MSTAAASSQGWMQQIGVLMSDFYTLELFRRVPSGMRCSFGGQIRGPRTMLKGAYLSGHDPGLITDGLTILFIRVVRTTMSGVLHRCYEG